MLSYDNGWRCEYEFRLKSETGKLLPPFVVRTELADARRPPGLCTGRAGHSSGDDSIYPVASAKISRFIRGLT